MSTPMELDQEPVIDEALYNRQMYVLGAETMKKMSTTKVLVSGLSGLGCEIAKNLILAGVASVTLHDHCCVTWFDLSSHFYATESDIGKNRATVSRPKLAELNKYVAVNELQGDLTEASLSNFQVVVFVDHATSSLVKYNEYCRQHGIKFISTESRGIAGLVFCDFGENFLINDIDGEEVVTCLITGVVAADANTVTITVHDDNRHNLEDNQKVIITDIEGPTQLNGEWPVKVTGPYNFTISVDTTNLPPYVRGGYVKPIKPTARKDFLSLAESLKKPEIVLTDYAKFDMPLQLHVWFQALHQYLANNNNTPLMPYNADEATKVIEIANTILATYQDHPSFGPLKQDVLLKITQASSGNLGPMAAFLGGFVAQEVLKACSGKFSPLFQWLYFDSIEILPDPLPSTVDCKATGTRYDGQIAVIGKHLQAKLLSQRNFVVGAGALGCEFLKNFAMMGLGCSPQGEVIVTDMDTIEKSNLSRQFLFRDTHIGSLKSETACRVVKAMNPSMNVRHMADKVAPETEGVFDDEFWERLDGVTNALDNVQARLFVDSKCVYYRKPLLESGTLGTKGNVQVVVPHITESYGSSRDPPEKSIPICTLKNFPNAIEHTIQWARDQFEGLFRQSAEDANSYLTRSDFLQQLEKEPASRVSTLENVYDALVKSRPATFPDCIIWARAKFDDFFNNQIRQLLFNFPVDTITNSGERFWSGPKRPPNPVVFDANDDVHLDFVVAAASLRAFNYDIPIESREEIKNIARSIQTPEFIPKKANIQVEDDKPAEADANAGGRTAEQIIASLPDPKSVRKQLCPAEFEKDNDENFHIDFVTACSNLRARNYKIPEVDRAKTKQIAGKIIPAMVTTTALITGLVSFEWYKLLQEKKLEDFKNAFVNLALPFVTLSEPMKPAISEYGSVKWNLWDRFDVDLGKDITLQEFLNYFENEHKLELSMISSGASIIYSFFAAKAKLAERLKKPVSEVVKEVSKIEFGPNQKYINMEVCGTYEDEDADVPYVRYKFR